MRASGGPATRNATILSALLGVLIATGASCSSSCSGEGDPPPPPSTAIGARSEAPQPFPLSNVTVPGFPDYRAKHGQQLQLDRLPATWTLPEVKLPPKVAAVTDKFVLDAKRAPRLEGGTTYVYKAALPFPLDLDEQTFRPEGMLVTLAGKAVPFSRMPAQNAKKASWRITGKFLIIASEAEIEPGTLEVTYAQPRLEIDRHNPQLAKDASGQPLSADAFAHYKYSIRGNTRTGLLLVAPMTGEWEVTLPTEAATFSAAVALERAPIAPPVSDGASLSLVVVDGGEETVAAELPLEGVSDAFVSMTADLTPWAGKSVKVRLVAQSVGTAVFDWVFVGAPTIVGPPAGGDVRRVVVIALDTTRQDHLSYYGYERPTTPEIDAFGKSGVVFDHTWSVAPRTRPSFRSSTTGRLPLDAVGATNLSEVFARNGFTTGGIVANPHLQPRFSFDVGYDSWSYDGRANAEQQVDRAMEWLQAHEQEDSYLFLHFMDPHAVYDAPGEYGEKFVTEVDSSLPPRPKRNQILALMKDKALSEVGKAQIAALHDGELAYTSAQLGRLFTMIDALPGRTLVVLHSDHGEEFWEHGGYEHNHSLYDELVRAVFMVRPVGGVPTGQRFDAPVSLMDIGPTLYDLFGIDLAPPVDGVSLMPMMAGQAPPARPIPVGYLQYDHERWGVIWNNHKYMLHTKDGREELFDLKADPGETKDVSVGADLAPYRVELAKAHKIVVGPGFRVIVGLAPKGPELVLELPAPARYADVLDPEAIAEHRANIEWGEEPKKLSFEVGAVELSADRKTLTFKPGTAPQGILYVVFDEPQDANAVKGTLGGTAVAFGQGERGPTWSEALFSVTIAPGIVVIPPPTEAARMGLGLRASASTSDIEMLCCLGYHEGPDCEGVVCDEEDAAGAAPELGD